MSSPCGRFFLHAVMRFLIESGTRANIFFVGVVWVATAVELEGVYPQPSLKVVPRAPKLEGEDLVPKYNRVEEVVVGHVRL